MSILNKEFDNLDDLIELHREEIIDKRSFIYNEHEFIYNYDLKRYNIYYLENSYPESFVYYSKLMNKIKREKRFLSW